MSDNSSVMSFLEQANKTEVSIDFSDLPSYDQYIDEGGLNFPLPSPLPLPESMSSPQGTSSSFSLPFPTLPPPSRSSHATSSSCAVSQEGESNNRVERETNEPEESNIDTKKSEVGDEKSDNNSNENINGQEEQKTDTAVSSTQSSGEAEQNAELCGFEEGVVEIRVIAKNEDKIVLALSDGVSQRQLIFCPHSNSLQQGGGGYGVWLLNGLVSLVPPSHLELMRGRLLDLDAIIKQQYACIIEHFVSQRKGIEKRVKSKIESRIEGWLEQKGRILLKQSLLGKEGEMPAMVQKTVSEVVDFVWPDVKIELWALYDSVMGHEEDSQWDLVNPSSPSPSITISTSPLPERKGSSSSSSASSSASTSEASALLASAKTFIENPFSIMKDVFFRFRCFVLFTLSPYNCSFGRKIKNVWWWFFKLVRVLPFYSMSSLSFLFTLLLIDRTDEFQLISFILEFKGTQFIGVGMISTLMGALKYISCVNLQPLVITLAPHLDSSGGSNSLLLLNTSATATTTVFTHQCDQYGPGSHNSFYLDFVAFVLQIILVWVAFFHLPYTKKRYKADEASLSAAVRDEFEVEDEWQVVDTEEQWALVGKGGKLEGLLEASGNRKMRGEGGDDDDDEEEDEGSDEENTIEEAIYRREEEQEQNSSEDAKEARASGHMTGQEGGGQTEEDNEKKEPIGGEPVIVELADPFLTSSMENNTNPQSDNPEGECVPASLNQDSPSTILSTSTAISSSSSDLAAVDAGQDDSNGASNLDHSLADSNLLVDALTMDIGRSNVDQFNEQEFTKASPEGPTSASSSLEQSQSQQQQVDESENKSQINPEDNLNNSDNNDNNEEDRKHSEQTSISSDEQQQLQSNQAHYSNISAASETQNLSTHEAQGTQEPFPPTIAIQQAIEENETNSSSSPNKSNENTPVLGVGSISVLRKRKGKRPSRKTSTSSNRSESSENDDSNMHKKSENEDEKKASLTPNLNNNSNNDLDNTLLHNIDNNVVSPTPKQPLPVLTAASTMWSLAYTSCAVFVSSTVNWTPSDTNRQQLRSFRTYLERLGTQRERGRLLYMLKYDLCVFCFLSTLFLASTLRRVWMFWDIPLSAWEWQIRADMYWLKTLYGLLSAPFVVFVLPVFAQVLLHLRPTGYTPDGRCVPQQRRGAPPPPPPP